MNPYCTAVTVNTVNVVRLIKPREPPRNNVPSQLWWSRVIGEKLQVSPVRSIGSNGPAAERPGVSERCIGCCLHGIPRRQHSSAPPLDTSAFLQLRAYIRKLKADTKYS